MVFEEEVTEDWVLNQSGLTDDVIQLIIDIGTDDGFFAVPEGTEVKLNDKTIVRVKFVPESTRSVIDTAEAVKHVIVEQLPAKRRRVKDNVVQKRKPKIILPRKDVKVAESFRVTYIDGTTIRVSEQFLRENFSDQYVDELKKHCHQQKYVDIPVGDFKRSHLYRYPQLRCIGAPRLGLFRNTIKIFACPTHWHLRSTILVFTMKRPKLQCSDSANLQEEQLTRWKKLSATQRAKPTMCCQVGYNRK